jgi:hypothetical protein
VTKPLRPTQDLINALFAAALVVIGWQAWVMANAGVDRAATLVGWFAVLACAGNLIWIAWFYTKRLLGISRRHDGAA